jgi:hypothetical protein
LVEEVRLKQIACADTEAGVLLTDGRRSRLHRGVVVVILIFVPREGIRFGSPDRMLPKAQKGRIRGVQMLERTVFGCMLKGMGANAAASRNAHTVQRMSSVHKFSLNSAC